MASAAELMNRGIQCLLNGMGPIDTEQFISNLMSNRFDYTEWQREHFASIDADEFYERALSYARENPFPASAS